MTTEQILGIALLCGIAFIVALIIINSSITNTATDVAGNNDYAEWLKKIFAVISAVLVPLALLAGACWLLLAARSGIDSLLSPPPDKKVWVEKATFGYTPNIAGWTIHKYSVPNDGIYRVVCTQGYTQRNVPTFTHGYSISMPCSGQFMPSVKRQNRKYKIAAQLVTINSVDLSDGKSAVKLTRSQEVDVRVMPNIDPHKNTTNVENLMRNNSGSARFSIQKLIEKTLDE